MKNKSKIFLITLYSLIFYGVWTLWEFYGKGALNSAVKNEYIAELIKSGIVKNLVWTLPAVLLTRHFNDDVYIGLNDMFTNKMNISKYIPIFLLFTVYIIIGAFITKGKLAISSSFKYSDLIIILFVGITEETVFRGWLLNATVSDDNKRLPIIINAVMFLMIHFPIWITSGEFMGAFTGFGFVCILVLSVIFSLSFIKSKSIWVPVALHTYWDLLTFLFF